MNLKFFSVCIMYSWFRYQMGRIALSAMLTGYDPHGFRISTLHSYVHNSKVYTNTISGLSEPVAEQ